MPRIVERKPHPNSSEHEVVVFMTKVRHEMQIPRGAGEDEVMRLIARYLRGYDITMPDGTKEHVKGYESIYPETEETKEVFE